MATTVGVTRAGSKVTVESVERALIHHERAGRLGGWARLGNEWTVHTVDGQWFELTGLAQAHALCVGLQSASTS